MNDEQSKKATPASVRKQNLNYIGENEADMQGFMVYPQDGRSPIHEDLDHVYNIKIQEYDEETGVREVKERSVWGLKTAISPDTRLSNLTKPQEEYVQWSHKAEGLCLMLGLRKSAAVISWKRTAIVEPSLGRGGFLRNNLQTIQTKQESVSIEENSKPRNPFGFFTGGKK